MTDQNFDKQGYCLVKQFLSESECERLLSLIAEFRKKHAVQEIYRYDRKRPLRYSVIDGGDIRRNLPEIVSLYEKVTRLVNQLGQRELTPLADERVTLNINITSKGGSYRWHYDRNAVTALLYLNSVAGGETECYPNYRLLLRNARFSKIQRLLDQILLNSWVRRFFGKLLTVSPCPGELFVMRGNRCLHSVRPVAGEEERIAVVMSYDQPGATFAVADQLDAYLYRQGPDPKSDPNYSLR